jgi:hypothetical protein
MTFPDIDSQDYVTNSERQLHPTIPEVVYVVYYLNIKNEWMWSLPTFYLENAQKHAGQLDCPTKILTYNLSDIHEVSLEERKVWRPKPKRRVRQPTHIPTKKVRRIRRIVE